jgi:hypothetical protein
MLVDECGGYIHLDTERFQVCFEISEIEKLPNWAPGGTTFFQGSSSWTPPLSLRSAQAPRAHFRMQELGTPVRFQELFELPLDRRGSTLWPQLHAGGDCRVTMVAQSPFTSAMRGSPTRLIISSIDAPSSPSFVALMRYECSMKRFITSAHFCCVRKGKRCKCCSAFFRS